MSLSSDSIPNLIGGVSQQSPSARSRTASQDELNTLPSAVSGLRKRPPFDWIAQVPGDVDETEPGVCHAFETADGSKFILLVDSTFDQQSRMTVIRSDGQTYSIDLTNDGDYIKSTQRDYAKTFRFLSIGDTTFILNRTITPSVLPVPETTDLSDYTATLSVVSEVDLPSASLWGVGTTAHIQDVDEYRVIRRTAEFSTIGGEDLERRVTNNAWFPFTPTTDRSRKDPKQSATYFIRQAVHDTRYAFTIEFEDGTFGSATFTTPEAVDGGGNPVSINTEDIISGLSSSYTGDGAVTPVGASLSVLTTKPIKKVTYTDGFGDQASEAYGESVQKFSDLPPNEIEGRVVRIQGAISDAGDDYFVEYRDGLWKETVAFGERSTLDDSTMPLTLVYDPVNDSFELKTHEWPGRTAGDSESNPDPTFVGRVINSMFLFKGRMVLLADENVLLSETGTYENFYRTSLTQYLESDPIDIASATRRTSVMYHGVPFDKSLVLFSDQAQFRLTSGDALTPDNVSIDQTTAFSASKTAAPIAVGPNVFFAHSDGVSKYASVLEYYVNPNTDRDDASDVTAAIPRFIEGDIVSMKASANEDIFAALTSENGGTMYVYRYYWAGERKAVSAWTKWKLEGVREIVSIDFFADELFAVIRDINDETHLLRANLEEGRTDTGISFSVHLDAKVASNALPVVYDAATDRTRLRFPMSANENSNPVLVINAKNNLDFPIGYVIAPVEIDNDLIWFDGDVRNLPAFAGFLYEMRYQFSPIYPRQRSGEGEVPGPFARLQLKYMTLYFSETAAFNVEVTPEGRQTYTDRYTGKMFSTPSSVLDGQKIDSDRFRFSCRGRSDRTQIVLINNTPFPSAFASADWEGQYHPKSRRV